MSETVVELIETWVTRLAALEPLLGAGPTTPTSPTSARERLSDTERIDLLGALEGLKAAAAATQERVTAAFATSQRGAMTAAGVPAGEQGRSIGAQVALARRVSPRQGSRHLGLAEALVGELPQVMNALTAGMTSEWRATLVARETACLSREDRQAVDAALSERPGGIASMGDAQIASEARRTAYRLDPGAVVRRSSKAVAERCVTLRPAPDAMSYLTAVLPVTSGVAAHVALARAADSARAQGDSRGRGQLMADLLVDRLTRPGAGTGVGTGVASSSGEGTRAPVEDPALQDPARWDSPAPPPVPEVGGESGHGAPAGVRVEVQVVMTDAALLGDDDTAAEVVGHGPVPAAVARRLVRDAPEEGQVWVRRLFTDPVSGGLAAVESRARHFPASLRRLLVLRDEVCRTPWCNAPVRHADHVVAHADGGPTSVDNGQGLCVTCNLVKEAPGWSAVLDPDGTVRTTTPTGHHWPSPPRHRWRSPPGRPAAAACADSGVAREGEARRGKVRAPSRAAGHGSPGERRLRELLAAA